MSWPRGSLLAALLVFSIPLASADTVTVNTTTDDDADNSLCSLREAVEYFNLDKPTAGYQGCVSSAVSAADTISVPTNSAAYQINSKIISGVDYGAIFVRRNLSITGGGQSGTDKTLIQVNGPHRAFIVSSTRTVAPPTCSLTNTCSPAGAPVLDPNSDTGTGPDATDYLTTVNTPKFSGSMNPPASGTTVRVTLYDQPVAATDDDPVVIGSALVSATGTWTITSASALTEGVHDISFTVTVGTEDEGEQSPKTRLAIYAADDPELTFSLSQVELQGCGLADCANVVDSTSAPSNSANGLVYDYPLTGTAGKGGLLYSNETLDLGSISIHGGAAGTGQGGAIYSGTDGVVAIAGSRVSGNSAASGAAIYAEVNAVFISASLLTDNTSAAGAAVVTVITDATAATITSKSLIQNSTFSGNHGIALSLRDGASINGSTIVLNEGGLDFNGTEVAVYNTILAGNPDNFPNAATATDCLNLPAVTDMDFQSSLGLLNGGCDTAPSGLQFLKNNDVAAPQEKLMAAADATGKCRGYQVQGAESVVFNGMGILCPLATRSEDEATATHLPRLLPVYSSSTESPIVAKGASSGSALCLSADQRSKSRRTLCDIGAVEIQPIVAPVLSGDAITYGQTYSEALDSELGDEELFVPTAQTGAGSCPAFALTQSDDKLRLVPGCPWITIPPTKGTVTFNVDGSYTYRPSSNYHGFDRFSFRVVTNLSKLNSTFDSQSRVVNAQIIVEPTSGISAYSAAGSADLYLLLSLVGLGVAGWRRHGRGRLQ